MTHSLHFGQPIIYYLLAALAIAAFVGLAIVPAPRRLGAKLELAFFFSMGAALFA
jgi:hypothetical protein